MAARVEGAPPFAAAYQGRPGAYSEAAARLLVGSEPALLPCDTLDDTFAALAGGRASHAVVPVENTLAGTVTKTYDLLLEHELHVIGERVQHIDHALIGRRGTTLAQVRRVLSHPVALAQCERFFRQHPECVAVPVFDTAGAVPLALEQADGSAAAIASAHAAEIYEGEILARHVQDHPENFTRFLLVATSPAAGDQSGPVKTIVTVRLPNSPGSLWHALEPFARAAINLQKIESRPVPGRPFEYAFVLEMRSSGGPGHLASALDSLKQRTAAMRVLGSFHD